MRLLRVTSSVVAQAAATLLGASVVVFAAVHLAPGSVVDFYVPPQAPESVRLVIAHRLGLDQSLPEQYWRWLVQAVQGNFGISVISHQPVLHEFASRATVTIELAILAIAFGLAIGLPAGLVSGIFSHRKGLSLAVRIGSVAGLSIPDFVIGTVLVYLFSQYHLFFTVNDYVPISASVERNLRAMVLPAIALGTPLSALTMRMTRDAVLNVLGEPYITAAIARGSGRWQIVRRHILRNAANPVLTVVVIFAAALLGGALIVETIFSLPGVGQLTIQAVSNRDYGVVQAGVLIAVAIFVIFNSIADFLYGVVDPRTTGARVR
jgi:peptide/nickel transport system permease protein